MQGNVGEFTVFRTEFAVLLTLLAGVWGSFGMITKIFEALNERRDLVLLISEGSERLDLSKRRRLALSDWLPLWLGSVFFLVVITCFFLVLAGVHPVDATRTAPVGNNLVTRWVASMGWSPTEALCYLSAVFAGFGFLANLLGGLSDFLEMLRAVGIREAKSMERQKVSR